MAISPGTGWLFFETAFQVNRIDGESDGESLKQRTVPYFSLKLIFSTLIRRCRRWQRVTFTEVEINFLDKLRKELGINDGSSEQELVKERRWGNEKAIHFYRKKGA